MCVSWCAVSVRVHKEKTSEIYLSYIMDSTSLVTWWSELLTTNHEVPGSIPGYHVRFFLKGEDAHGDHGLGSW